MRVLLAHPPVKYPLHQKTGDTGFPLGLLYLKSYLQQHNPEAEVKVRDFRRERFLGKTVCLEQVLAEFDLVAVGTSTADYSSGLEIIKIAKSFGKETVMGGVFPSFHIEYVLNSGVVDYVVRKEGEETLSQLLKAGKPVPGVSFRTGNGIFHLPERPFIDLSQSPAPDFKVLNLSEYQPDLPGMVYSARGCAFNCRFCSISPHWNFSYRAEPVPKVLGQIQTLIEAGFKEIIFQDENLALDKSKLNDLLNELNHFKANFSAKSRLDNLTAETVNLLSKAGFTTLTIGLESFSEEVLTCSKKNYTFIMEKLLPVLESGLQLRLHFILGLAGETQETLKRTADQIIWLSNNYPAVQPLLCFFTPYPGTEQSDHFILTTDFDRYNSVHPVAVPFSLGENGLEFLISTYQQIVKATDSSRFNPLLDTEYCQQLLDYRNV